MKTKLKNIAFTLAYPLIAYCVMEFLCLTLKQRHLISTILDVKTLIRNTGIAAIMAFALSFNLSCGRLDLSLGAQRLAGTIIGGYIALSLGLSGIWLLVFAVVFGMLFGFVTGVLFITTRVPPMVLGIGVGLIWECFPYVITQGKGLNLFGVSGMGLLTDTGFIIGLVVVTGAFVTILLNSTKFGYQMRAIQGSQLISRNSGINIFRHAVICYTLAGALVCIAGVMDVSFSTQMSATLGLVSNGPVIDNMFAMILGNYIGERSNQAIGVIIAALSIKLFSYGLTTLELSEANASVANMVLFVGFLVFLANKDVLKNKKAAKARVALAHEKKKAMLAN